MEEVTFQVGFALQVGIIKEGMIEKMADHRSDEDEDRSASYRDLGLRTNF